MAASILLLALCAAPAASLATLPATSPLLRWSGRPVPSPSDASVSFDWLLTSATFSVTGATSVSATLSTSFWGAPPAPSPHARALQQAQYPKFGVYRVYVNGARTSHGLEGVVVLPGAPSLYQLTAGLNPALAYNLTLAYTTDAVFNSWPDLDLGRGCVHTVHTLSTDGAFAPPPPPRARHMLILGDSITSGNAMYKPCDNATKCDASQSYASLLCESFALNCTMLTASSKGLVHNCCDGLPVTVPALANRTFAQDNGTLWDWGAHPAFDAVWVHLGTNDGAQSPPAVFTAAYLSLLLHLAARATSRAAPIFAAWGPNSATPAPWIAAAAAQGRGMGLNVTLVDLMAAPLDGCGHPGVVGHPTMARIAAPIVAGVTGWAHAPL